ncbi:MAG TPA: alpha-ketoacid dehydrogenase subunit beta [Dehalococcoidia bacterium]
MVQTTVRDAIRDGLRRAMLDDERVVLMGEDIGAYGGSYSVTKGLLDEFGPDRVIDTPIAESVVVGCGIGAAMAGMRPIVEVMTINFSLLAIDQIINNASKIHYMSDGQINVPLIIRMASGGGSQLSAQHSHSLEGWYAHVPGLVVACPSNPADARGLLNSALDEPNPVIFIENTSTYRVSGEAPDGEYRVPFGVARTLRSGSDVTIVAYAGVVARALESADGLTAMGIEAEVIDPRTLRPLDVDSIVESVRKTGRLVVVEDDWRFGGFGAEIAAQVQELAFDYLDAPVARVAGVEVPMPYNASLEAAAMPSVDDIVEAAARLVSRPA